MIRLNRGRRSSSLKMTSLVNLSSDDNERISFKTNNNAGIHFSGDSKERRPLISIKEIPNDNEVGDSRDASVYEEDMDQSGWPQNNVQEIHEDEAFSEGSIGDYLSSSDEEEDNMFDVAPVHDYLDQMERPVIAIQEIPEDNEVGDSGDASVHEEAMDQSGWLQNNVQEIHENEAYSEGSIGDYLSSDDEEEDNMYDVAPVHDYFDQIERPVIAIQEIPEDNDGDASVHEEAMDQSGRPQNNVLEIHEDEAYSEGSIGDYLSSDDEEEDNMFDVAPVHDYLDQIERPVIAIQEIPEDNDGDASVHEALDQEEWRLEDFRLMLERDPRKVSLHRVLMDRRCSVDLVKLLLQYGADPNRDLLGRPTLPRISPIPLTVDFCLPQIPLEINKLEILKVLVEGGARADQPNDCSLGLAVGMNADIEVIKLLVRAGADLLRADITKEVPLFRALKFFDIKAFRLLLDLLPGVDLNLVRDRNCDTLLHGALRIPECTPDFVTFLIDRGIPVNSVNKHGDTPLTLALQTFPDIKIDVFDVLLKRGSRLRSRYVFDNYSPDHIFTASKSLDVKQLLLKYLLIEEPGFEVRAYVSDVKMWSYGNDCKLELQRMHSEIVGDGRTLFKFLKNYSGTQIRRNGENGFDINRILQIILNKLFPLYSYVIASKLGHALLKDKFQKCHVRTTVENSTGVRREISLNFECAGILANYLNEHDLLNMIIACCK